MKKDRLRRIARAAFWTASLAQVISTRKLAAKRAHDAQVKRAKRAAAKVQPAELPIAA